jgi:hypothetical protein
MPKFSTILISEPGKPDMFLQKIAGPNRFYTLDHKKAAKANNKAQQQAWGLSVAQDKAGRGSLGKGKGKAKGLENGKAFSFFATIHEVDVEEIEIKQLEKFVLTSGKKVLKSQIPTNQRNRALRVLPAQGPITRIVINPSE